MPNCLADNITGHSCDPYVLFSYTITRTIIVLIHILSVLYCIVLYCSIAMQNTSRDFTLYKINYYIIIIINSYYYYYYY